MNPPTPQKHAMNAAPRLGRRGFSTLLLASLAACATVQPGGTGDPLPAWREGARMRAILDFVAATTTERSPDVVTPAWRLALFANDGTLWVEQPMHTQIAFAPERVRALAPQHPEWRRQEPFRSVLANDHEGLARSGMRGLIEIIRVSHAGMSPDAFHVLVEDWLSTVRNPRFLGRMPQAALGNSDGDYEMLQYVTTAPGRRLGMLVHHEDAEREFAYDRESLFGGVDRGLNDAAGRGWHLVLMKQDWARIVPG